MVDISFTFRVSSVGRIGFGALALRRVPDAAESREIIY